MRIFVFFEFGEVTAIFRPILSPRSKIRVGQPYVRGVSSGATSFTGILFRCGRLSVASTRCFTFDVSGTDGGLSSGFEADGARPGFPGLGSENGGGTYCGICCRTVRAGHRLKGVRLSENNRKEDGVVKNARCAGGIAAADDCAAPGTVVCRIRRKKSTF